jgi:hypothetical protein
MKQAEVETLRQALNELSDLRSSMSSDEQFVQDGGIDVLDRVINMIAEAMPVASWRWWNPGNRQGGAR